MRSVSFAGSGRSYVVGKLLCLGKNYAEHAREMDGDVPEVPVVFLKPATAILSGGGEVLYPSLTHELHHEVELVLLIGRTGKDIPIDAARGYIAGYAVGLDMTMRDVQRAAKKEGDPWSVAKGFDTSAPVSAFRSSGEIPDPQELAIRLSVNGAVRQQSNTREMIFGIDRTVSYLSGIFTLEEGDLIFTGTPEGVGPVVRGDRIEAEIERVGILTVTIG
jgi:acylpyruvate hydrolase